MFSRKELYYEGQAVGDTYLDTPGLLQLNRLLNQQPGIFLQNNAALSVMHKRSVVINDWSNELRNDESVLYQYIALLLDEGFPVYQIQKDTVVPIPNPGALSLMPSGCLNEGALFKLLNDHNLEKKKVYLLNHDKIVQLLDEFTQNNVFNFTVFPTMQPSLEKQNGLPKMSTPGCLVLANRTQVKTCVDESIYKLHLSNFWDESVLTACNPNNLTTLHLSQVPEKGLRNLVLATPNAKTMYIRPHLQKISLNIFSHLQRLEKLTLQESSAVAINKALPNLRRLTLFNLSMNATELELLLQYMPNLETLQLQDVAINGEFNKLCFTPLKRLILASCTMSNSVISSLVNQSQALVSLEINLKQPEYLEFEPKQFLRLLKLSNVGIKAKSLEALCSESLVSLDLESIKLDGELTFSHSLKHLARLKTDRFIHESNKTWDNLSNRAPYISDLVLTGAWNDLLIPKFPNLHFIQILGSLLTTREQGIKELQNLHKLTLDTDINMHLGDEFIRYRQKYSMKEPVMALDVRNMLQDLGMPIIQVCPWIKTITVGDTYRNSIMPIQNPPDRKWCIATSINTTSRNFEDWKSMEINWKIPMQIKIDDFMCQFFMKNKAQVMSVSGKISAEDFSLLLQKFPKYQRYDLEFINLDISGELKTLPSLNVNSLLIANTKLQAANLAILINGIVHSNLHIFSTELLAPFEKKHVCCVKKAYVDQSSWNNGLFYLLRPEYLVLTIQDSDIIKANEGVRTLECVRAPNQQTLTAFNHAFENLESLHLWDTVLDNFKLTTTNRFKVDFLSIQRMVDKSSGMQGLIQQFPKVKNLLIKQFHRTLLLDFKKYCPDLETMQLVGDRSLFKTKDLTYLIKALPVKCKIDLFDFYLSSELEQLITKYPQIVIRNCTFETHKVEKKLVPDFTPYDPRPSALDSNWNQGMLINRLISYQNLLFPSNNLDIPLLKKGICSAVAKWFADTVEQKGLNTWNEQWKSIKSWDKQLLPPNNSTLRIALEELNSYVFRYQIANAYLHAPAIITNDLNQFLDSPPNKPLLVSNAWHRTCLMYKENQWIYFDPNYKYGMPQCFSTKEDVVREITRVLGLGLSIVSFDEPLKPCWNQSKSAINAFLEAGGFGLIITNQEEMKKLEIRTLNKQALEGLFFLNVNNTPFWYLGLTQGRTGNPLQYKTLSLLAKYAKLTSDNDLVNAMTKGMSYLNTEKRQPLKASLSKRKGLQNCVGLIVKCAENTSLPNVVVDTPWLPEKQKLEPLDLLEVAIESEPIISKKSVQIKTPVYSQGINAPTTLTLNHPFLLNLAYANYQKNPTEFLGNSPFKTWVMDKLEDFDTLQKFDDFLSKHHHQNLLLHIPDNDQALNYLHHLQASELIKARGLYVINSFDDLHCAMSTIIVDTTGKGIIKPPNSGPFYDFLIENASSSPIIAVNWSNFTPQQLIQANTLIDKHRNVDRVAVPKEALILGVQNPKSPKAYLGSDFSSRHSKLCEFPKNLNILDVELPKLKEGSHAQECVIDLYGESNWEAYFYGTWKLTEKGFFFEKSALLQALEKKPDALNIVLKNAPFDEPDFKFAFNSLVSKGYCSVNGQRFELPKNRGISLKAGYDFKKLFRQTVVSMERGYLSQDDDCVLNRDVLAIFFENYQIVPDTKTLITLPGLLKNYAKKTLSLCLTSSLSPGTYARLLEVAKSYNIKIKLKVAPGVVLPEVIKPFMTENIPVVVSEPSSTRLIVSNDVHCTEKMLQKEKPFDMVIDISEESKDKLFYAISGQLTGDKAVFNETMSDLWHALMNNKRVLLKGHFSQTLIDAFANLLKPKGGIYNNGGWEIPTGELVLLTDSEKGFSFVSQIDKVEVSFDDKMALLGLDKEADLLEKYSVQDLSTFSYSYLLELALTKVLPEKPDDLINPFLKLPDLPYIDEDYGLEEAQSEAFKESRKTDLLGALDSRPTVFLSGETAVGKSSFMHELENEPFISITFNDIDAWLNPTVTNKLNILFIDEANLVKTDWLIFEGLYSTPPSLFYKGRYYPLDDTFKVVFAGNPANYSLERRLAKLFQNHPNSVVFGAMNNAYLHHEVLKPILGNNKEVARLFLKTFQAVKEINKEAISARELQMMAYLFQAQNLSEDVIDKAKVIAFNMACQVLAPKEKPTFNAWFVKEFGGLKPELEKMPQSIGRFSSKTHKERHKKMLLTPSHYEVYRGLDAFMGVRLLKQQWHGKASFGGLSGFVLEGEPGVGKSYFVKEFLLDSGFYEEKIDETSFVSFDYETFKKSNPKPSSHYYYLPANLSFSVKIDLLNRAFHEGAVVIIDEINASPLLEELMNALLMGEDLKGRRALIPGFSLIGTQNPSSMEGRELASKASARRVMHYNFPTYTSEEMVAVLIHKGLEVERASAVVYEFLCRQHYARRHNLHPEPCFRDVLREAKTILKRETLNSNPSLIQLPYAETVLISLLNLNNPNHRNLILQIRGVGYEKFFYMSEDNELCFLSNMQGDLKQTLLDNRDVGLLASHLKEIIKSQAFVGMKVIGNGALKRALMNAPLEDLPIFLKTACFEQIDFLQLGLDLIELAKPRFNIVGKVFKEFCRQVDEASSSNINYKEIIEKKHPESVLYSKDRFFSVSKEVDNEKSPIATFQKKCD